MNALSYFNRDSARYAYVSYEHASPDKRFSVHTSRACRAPNAKSVKAFVASATTNSKLTAMRLLFTATLLAVASAFTTQPNAFTTVSPSVGERADPVFADQQSGAHRTRRATIVMDGKANGESRRFCFLWFVCVCISRSEGLREEKSWCSIL